MQLGSLGTDMHMLQGIDPKDLWHCWWQGWACQANFPYFVPTGLVHPLLSMWGWMLPSYMESCICNVCVEAEVSLNFFNEVICLSSVSIEDLREASHCLYICCYLYGLLSSCWLSSSTRLSGSSSSGQSQSTASWQACSSASWQSCSFSLV